MDKVFEFFRMISIVLVSILGALIGVLEGFIKCSISYFKGIKYSFYKNHSVKAKERFDEPAKEMYFFYKQYEDLKNTYLSAESINKGNALVFRQLDMASSSIPGRFKAAKFSAYVWGKFFNIFWAVIHFTIITIISLPIYIYYFIVVTLEKIRLKKRNVSVLCIHCHSKFNIPYYMCPNCNRIHKQLEPGAYGIVKRKCICGTKIPTTNFGGRYKLTAICPVCLKKINTREASPVAIAVIGEKPEVNAYYVNNLLNKLVNTIPKNKNWDVTFLSNNEEQVCKGHVNVKNIFINSKKFSNEKLLYLYNNPQGDFSTKDNIVKEKYYRYIDGIILIIDLMHEGKIKNSVESLGEVLENKVNLEGINDLLDRLIVALRQVREYRVCDTIDIPIAIIVNKMDLLSYEGNAIEFIKYIGEDKIIRKIDHNFSKYKFFKESDLGYTSTEDKSFQWVLEQCNEEFK